MDGMLVFVSLRIAKIGAIPTAKTPRIIVVAYVAVDTAKYIPISGRAEAKTVLMK